MVEKLEIEKAVFASAKTLVPKGWSLKGKDRLYADLKMLSDDATTMALDLERGFGVRIPREEWRKVETLDDVINLFDKYLNHSV